MTQTSPTPRDSNHANNSNAIRPFQVNFPDADLAELRRCINATKWPERETVTDASQGVQLATIQALARYWATDYDWRKIEAKLDALPQFVTEIEGLDIQVQGSDPFRDYLDRAKIVAEDARSGQTVSGS